MKNQFEVAGYNLARSSSHDYTHAVVFKNLTTQRIGASYHSSEELAQKAARGLAKRLHLQFIQVAPVIKKVGA